MPLRSDVYYRQLVDEQVKQAGVSEPPVPVTDIAATIGVPIMNVALPAWFSGSLVMMDGFPVVLLNASGSAEGRRRALAHMLGHLLMRIDDPTIPYPRDAPEHRTADAMAEEFIMPEPLVREQAMKWFNDYRYLARLFGVSEADMLERMRDLKLIRARGIDWDY